MFFIDNNITKYILKLRKLGQILPKPRNMLWAMCKIGFTIIFFIIISFYALCCPHSFLLPSIRVKRLRTNTRNPKNPLYSQHIRVHNIITPTMIKIKINVVNSVEPRESFARFIPDIVIIKTI